MFRLMYAMHNIARESKIRKYIKEELCSQTKSVSNCYHKCGRQASILSKSVPKWHKKCGRQASILIHLDKVSGQFRYWRYL